MYMEFQFPIWYNQIDKHIMDDFNHFNALEYALVQLNISSLLRNLHISASLLTKSLKCL